jgi:hypothetical protein
MPAHQSYQSGHLLQEVNGRETVWVRDARELSYYLLNFLQIKDCYEKQIYYFLYLLIMKKIPRLPKSPLQHYRSLRTEALA